MCLGMLNLFNYVHDCSWFGSAVLTKYLTLRARLDELFSQDGWAVGSNRIGVTVTGHPRFGSRPREGQRLPQEIEILAKARHVVNRNIALTGIAHNQLASMKVWGQKFPITRSVFRFTANFCTRPHPIYNHRLRPEFVAGH